MPVYIIESGFSPGFTQSTNINYWNCIGDADYSSEVRAQILIRDSYTWSNLFVMLNFNTLTVATTVTARINGAGGNQSINIPAGTTGAFQDLVNSDALVSGDLICIRIQFPVDVGNSIKVVILAGLLTTLANTVPILATFYTPGATFSPGSTYYNVIMGQFTSIDNTNETFVQYTFRTTSTLSNMRTYVRTNTCDQIATARVRINDGNGNEAVSIPAGTTGAFEDAVNTDNIAIGDSVNYSLAIPAGAGLILICNSQVKSNSAAQQVAEGRATDIAGGIGGGLTVYYAITGNPFGYNAVETEVNLPAQSNFIARNLFVRVVITGGGATVRLRKNNANGNMSVTIPIAATGAFEDNVNTDTFGPADVMDYQVVTTGQTQTAIVGMELVTGTSAPGQGGGGQAGKLVAAGII